MGYNDIMKRITLIGGAPVTGKTTISQTIAKEEGGVQVSSDSVRSWMKYMVSAHDYPGLFYEDDMTAEEFYAKYTTAQSVVDGEIAEGIQVQRGIRALLNSSVGWDHIILEGIAITPDFMHEIIAKYTDLEVRAIILVDEDEGRIHRRISSRGLWGPLDTYPASLIPTEVEWVILYNQWFKEQAKQYAISVRYCE